MKLLTILGARPQFIKAGAVSRVIRETPGIKEVIVHTGQHYDDNMSDIFFSQMDIPRPDHRLSMGNLSHGAMTGRMLEQVEAILLKEKPDQAMVYGDTNSTLAGALAASKLHIPLAHVEAGLRSYNMKMPEEINRVLTDRVSTWLFCPTDTAISNLEDEGYQNMNVSIIKSGDVMLDAARFYGSRALKGPAELGQIASDFILCTFHRAENTDSPERLQEIVTAINTVNKEIDVVVPLHPRTRATIERMGLRLDAAVVDPVGYLEMVYLLKHCKLVLTDSGGLQKEAYFFSRPCVTMREETEWSELVDLGFNVLTGADSKKIVEQVGEMLNRDVVLSDKLYGRGNASEVIVQSLLKSSSIQ